MANKEWIVHQQIVDELPECDWATRRTGMRSTFLWALARAQKGDDAETLVRKAASAGYDLTPIRPYLG